MNTIASGTSSISLHLESHFYAEGWSKLAACKRFHVATYRTMLALALHRSPGCTGQVQLEDGPIYLVPKDMFGKGVVDAIQAGCMTFQALLSSS